MKAALLSSLAYRPELVVLDEPFSGLDPLVRDELSRGLLGAAGDRAWSVLVSSHDIDEIERLADWIGFIEGGRLVFSEPVASLLDRFRRIEVVAQEGEAPPLPPGISGLSVERAGRTLRFVDDHHPTSDVERQLSAAVPGAAVTTSPVPLREIFVTLARDTASKRRTAPGHVEGTAEAL
jgi:ABC-2 type transport system ATP-binding protein